jgi:MGT family glycosyltransferase
LFRGGPLVDMLAWGLPSINAMRSRYGVAPVSSFAEVHDACALSLVATPREFEPAMPVAANTRFIGPVLDAPPLAQEADHPDLTDGPDPLVVVSLSTSYQAQIAVLQRIVEALGGMPARVVVTTGHAVDPEAIAAPANTQVVRFVPHERLLPAAALVVTHAGLGTLMTALGHGVPVVCLPMGRDQFFNASRVEDLGAGRVLDADASAAAVADTVRAALADAAIRAAAKQIAAVIAGYGGAADAVDELEKLFTDPQRR